MQTKPQTVTFGELPSSSFVRKLTILSAAGVFLDGYDLSIISVALVLLTPQFHPNSFEVGFVGAAAVAGMFFGALVLGNLTDKVGRRKMYLLDLLFFVVFAILAALSQDIWELIAFRFLLGVGLGADYPISSTITAEFSPILRRGRNLVLTIGGFTAGAFISYLVALALLHTGPDAWRFMLATGAIPAIVVVFLRRSIPESPRWLMQSGDSEGALKIATTLASNAGYELDQANPGLGSKLPLGGSVKLGDLKLLFSRDLVRLTIFASVTWMLFDIGNYATIVFTPTLLDKIKGSTLTGSVLVSGGVQFIGLIGIAITFLLVDRVGRKPIQVYGFGLLVVAFIVLGIVSNPSFLVLAIFFVVVVFSDQGPGITTYLFAGEIFPTSVRASGHGVATATSRIGAFLGIVALPVFVSSVGLRPALITFGVADLIGLLLTVWLAPEPKATELRSDLGSSDGTVQAPAAVSPT